MPLIELSKLIIMSIRSYEYSIITRAAKGKRFIPFILFILYNPASGNDFTMPPAFPALYNQIFSLETTHARSRIATLPPNGPFRIYLENYLEFIEILNSNSESSFNLAQANEVARLNAIESLDPSSPYNRFLRSEILIQWAILKLKSGKETKGIYNLVQASRLLSANRKEFPGFIPHYKSLGTIHVITGSVPDNYKWALKLLGLKGTVNQGFSELEKAAKDEIWGNEALYCFLFLKAFTARFGESDNRALLSYINSRPGDLNARFLGASVSLRTRQADQGLKILSGLPSGNAFLKCPVFDLHRGDSYLMTGDYHRAVNAYQNYLLATKGKTYLKDTHLKLYYAYRFSGNGEKSSYHFKMVTQSGNSNSDLDKNAVKIHQLISREQPQKALLQAKIATEGGYYKETLKYLKQVDTASLNNEWLSEYYFLSGICHHQYGQLPEAEAHLKKAITISSKTDWVSESANAALHLGYVYQSARQEAQARVYFEKALSYKAHELKNTVDIKARTALAGLNSSL